MRINFLIPTTGITGGIKVIFEHANNLASRGHEVTLIYPYVLEQNAKIGETLFGKVKKLRREVLNLFVRDRIKWFNLKETVKIIRVWNLSAKFIPSADATIATANQTADWLAQYPAEKGKKFYFIQDYEIWTRDRDKVDATWKFPLTKIVISGWLEKLAREKFGQEVAGVILDGVDFKKFHNKHKIINQNKKILMMYHPFEKKGFAQGLTAFKMAQAKHPEISLTLFGAYRPPLRIRKEFKFYFKPEIDWLRRLYGEHDIFLWPSLVEGFGLPPLEAMACQTAVISTDTGAIREIAVDNESVLIVPPGRPDLMAEKIIRLVEDENLLVKFGLAGYNKVKNLSWEKATAELEKILLR